MNQDHVDNNELGPSKARAIPAVHLETNFRKFFQFEKF